MDIEHNRVNRLEKMVKELQAARDADLAANSTLFIRLHNVEQRLALFDAPVADFGTTSDGYHTFNELYEHRHVLFLMFFRNAFLMGAKTWVELDPDMPDWFLAGADLPPGQVSYHLPMRLFDMTQGHVSKNYERKPYDGYSSKDVLHRLQTWCGYKEANRGKV